MAFDSANRLLDAMLEADGETRSALCAELRGRLADEFFNTLDMCIIKAFEKGEMPQVCRLIDVSLCAGEYLKRDDVLYNACLFKGFALAGSDDAESVRWFQKALDKALVIKGDSAAPFDINSQAGMALRNISTIQHRQGLRQLEAGDNDGAADFFSSAISSAQQLISQPGIEQSYKSLAYALEYAGRNEDAVENYGKAAERFETIGDKTEAANVLLYKAGCLKTLGRFRDALAALKHASDIFYALENKTMTAEVSVRVADIYLTGVGDYDKALEHLENIVGSGRREQESTALMQMAVINLDRGSYSLMLQYLEKIVSLLSPPASDMERCGLADAYSSMAEAHFLLRDFVKTEAAERMASDLARSNNYRAGIMRLCESMGNRSYNLGRYEEALKHYEEAMEIAREPEDIKTKIRILRGRGFLYLSIHCREDALKSFSDTLALSRQYNLRGDEIRNMCDMGYCTAQAGRYEEALELYRGAISLCESLEDPTLLAAACRKDMAAVLSALGNTSEAFTHLSAAREIHHGRGLQRDEVYDCMELGMLAHKSKDFAKARQFYAEGIELCSEPGMTDEKVNCLHGQAFADAAEGNYDQALDNLESAWKLLDPSKDRFLVFTTQYALGIVNKKKGNIEKAAEHYMTAWKYMDVLREASTAEELRIQWMADKKTLAEETVEVLLLLGRIEEAFHYVEKAKSRVLAELLGLSKLRKPREIGTDHSVSEDDLLAQARSIQSKMRAARGDEGQYMFGAALSAVSARLNDLWGTMDSLYAGSSEVKAYLSLRRGDAVSMEETLNLIGAIPGTTAIVEYFQHRERLYIFILRSDKQRASVVEVAQPEAGIREIITAGIQNNSVSMSAFRLWELNLAGALVEPIVEFLDGCDLIYFVPFGDIVRLPLHAFSTAAGFRLIEKYDVAYIPSASLLRFCLEGSSLDSSDSLVMAFEGRPPDAILSHAYPEAQAVSSVLGKTEMCLGADATIWNLIGKGKDKRVIHLACHGEFNADAPMSSSLHLYDGVLTADEIFQKVELDARLVTLSACQTGQAAMRPGDETFGLIRAFLHAGVSAILVSLWNLNDEKSSAFMEKFYCKTATMPAAKALAETEREMLAGPGSHPYFWAPFILIGNYR